jgi:hypothetical protein
MVFYLYSDSKGLGAEGAFPLRDPAAVSKADEVQVATPWKPPVRSWEPWWARSNDGYGSGAWPTAKREPWWKREGHDAWWPSGEDQAYYWPPSPPSAYKGNNKDGCYSDEATTKKGSSHSDGNSTCSSSDEEDAINAWEEVASSVDSVPTSPAATPFKPPPGLELPPPAGPPPGLPAPRGLTMPCPNGLETPTKKTTLSLVDMLVMDD